MAHPSGLRAAHVRLAEALQIRESSSNMCARVQVALHRTSVVRTNIHTQVQSVSSESILDVPCVTYSEALHTFYKLHAGRGLIQCSYILLICALVHDLNNHIEAGMVSSSIHTFEPTVPAFCGILSLRHCQRTGFE